LSGSHKREFFWVSGEATGDANLAELEEIDTVPERRHNSGDEIGRSNTLKGGKQPRRKGPSDAGGKESDKAEGMNELSTSKRRRSEKDGTGKATEGYY
jgi:hypothetical protein